MKTQTIHARVSPQVKKASEKILKSIGLTMSEAIGLFLKQLANRKEFPLELRVPNAETIRALKASSEGKNLISYSNVEELIKHLGNEYQKGQNRQSLSKRLSANAKARKGNRKTGRDIKTSRRRKTPSPVMQAPQA